MNQLVCELVRRGHDVVVVSCDHEVAVGQEIVLGGTNLQVRYGPYRTRHRARDAFRVERQYLADALRHQQADVVHAHWNYEFALGAMASGHPTLITCHDWGPAILRHIPDAYRLVRLGMQGATLRRGRFFTAVSPYIQKRVTRVARGPVAVVPNGLERSAFRGGARQLHERPTLVAINAGFGRLKNVTTLLRAYALVRQRRTDVQLRLFGAGYELGGAAHRWALRYDVTDGVEFCGPVPYAQMTEVLCHADVLVHPSREESFGMVLIEAMAHGVPVIGGGGSGAVPWVLGQGRAGVLTDVTAPEKLARAIESVIDDDDLWRRLSRSGLSRALSEFTIGRTTALYEEQYVRVRDGIAAA